MFADDVINTDENLLESDNVEEQAEVEEVIESEDESCEASEPTAEE